ncbi:hypothetical protein NPIL_95141, partial [Nephila pilipes]
EEKVKRPIEEDEKTTDRRKRKIISDS